MRYDHDRRAGFERVFARNFRNRIRAGEEDGVLVHRANHVLRYRVAFGDADKDVGSDDRVFEDAGRLIAVRQTRDFNFRGIRLQTRVAFANNALRIADDNVSQQTQQVPLLFNHVNPKLFLNLILRLTGEESK